MDFVSLSGNDKQFPSSENVTTQLSRRNVEEETIQKLIIHAALKQTNLFVMMASFTCQLTEEGNSEKL
jgi:hypothetical protein